MANYTGTLSENPLYGTPQEDSFYDIVGDKTIYGGDSGDEFTTNQEVRGTKIFYGEGGDDLVIGNYNDLQVAAYHGNRSDYTVSLTTPSVASIKYFTTISDKTGAEGFDRLLWGVDEIRFADKSLYWIGDHWSATERMTEGDDKISLKDGDDIIAGRGGDDSIRGNAGEDEIYGGNGNDTLRGGNGNDQLDGGEGDDYLYGGEGNDGITDYFAGKNHIYGENGDDGISAIANSSTVHGGEGNDYIYFYETLEGTYGFGDGGDDHLFTSGAITATTLNGGEGNDVLISRILFEPTVFELTQHTGDACFLGGAGSDKFVFEDGAKGNILVRDFVQGEDTIEFINNFTEYGAYTSFSDVLAHATANTRGDVVIDNGAADAQVITLYGMKLADIDASDFSFS